MENLLGMVENLLENILGVVKDSIHQDITI